MPNHKVFRLTILIFNIFLALVIGLWLWFVFRSFRAIGQPSPQGNSALPSLQTSALNQALASPAPTPTGSVKPSPLTSPQVTPTGTH